MVTQTAKRNNPATNQIIIKNMDILLTYLTKGKDIEKVFFSFRKILLSNPIILAKTIEPLMDVVKSTKNKLLIVQSLKLLKKCLKGKPFKGL